MPSPFTEPQQFGDLPHRDWRDHVDIPSAKDEATDTEDATAVEKDFARSTLESMGVDTDEVFKK